MLMCCVLYLWATVPRQCSSEFIYDQKGNLLNQFICDYYIRTNHNYIKGVLQWSKSLFGDQCKIGREKRDFHSCLETRENEQNVVLNESSEALRNHSGIVRTLVLAMTFTADDGASRTNFVREVVALLLMYCCCCCCFTIKMVLSEFVSWLVKTK